VARMRRFDFCKADSDLSDAIIPVNHASFFVPESRLAPRAVRIDLLAAAARTNSAQDKDDERLFLVLSSQGEESVMVVLPSLGAATSGELPWLLLSRLRQRNANRKLRILNAAIVVQ
jgi:hypothetical protein